MNMNEEEARGEDLEDLFLEIWERESKPELRFDVPGVGEIIQAQDLNGDKWSVNNFSNTVWEAAIWMHHFFQDQRCFPRERLRGCRVLDVGAGTGLVGLTLALLGAEVMMTDLEEALPILAHNVDATFQLRSTSDTQVEERCELQGIEDNGSVRKPMIRRLRWGCATDAADVAAEAAAASAAGGTKAKWRGFDMIVVRAADHAFRATYPLWETLESPGHTAGADVVYNESSHQALMSTLSDSHLCSPATVIYLATKLRGGLHELFLDRLASIFHVHCLREPRRSDESDSRAEHPVARCGSAQPFADNSPAVNVPGLLVGINVLGSPRRPSSTLPTCSRKGNGEGQDREWSCGVPGLGTVLAFAAWERQKPGSEP